MVFRTLNFNAIPSVYGDGVTIIRPPPRIPIASMSPTQVRDWVKDSWLKITAILSNVNPGGLGDCHLAIAQAPLRVGKIGILTQALKTDKKSNANQTLEESTDEDPGPTRARPSHVAAIDLTAATRDPSGFDWFEQDFVEKMQS